MADVMRNLPPRTAAMDIDALRAGMKGAASHGIASVQEAGEGLDQLPLYRALLQRRQLTMRVRLAFDMVPGMDQGSWGRRLDAYDEAAREVPKSGLISTGILKAFADGVIESRTASVLEAYAGTAPVVPLDPFASVHVAVNRQTLTGEPPGGWLPHERLSLEDALAGWTSGSAYAEHMEEHKGALKVGMLADIAVLDRDLRKVPSSEI